MSKKHPYINVNEFRKKLHFSDNCISKTKMAILDHCNDYCSSFLDNVPNFEYKNVVGLVNWNSKAKHFEGCIRNNKVITFSGESIEETFENFKHIVITEFT